MENNHTISNDERQEEIWQIIRAARRISVANICERYQVSEATARRDLNILEQQGKIQRVHGGAIAVQRALPEPPILLRSREQAAEKQRIGAVAASLVCEGETVFLGSGTTVLEVACCLRNYRNLTVITNSLGVIELLSEGPDINVISLGGMFRKTEGSFIGYLAEQVLQELRPQKVIMGIRAISVTHGLTNDYMPEVSTDRLIIRSAPEVLLVADHTKFGAVSTAFVAPITSVHKIITDSGTPEDVIADIRRAGIEVFIS